jgi:hypothetical protein
MKRNPFASFPYLVLLRVMLALPSMSPCMRWALTPPFHPYRDEDLERSTPLAVCFLWRSCRIAPPGRYPAPCPLESGLSSHSLAQSRTSDHLTHSMIPWKRIVCQLEGSKPKEWLNSLVIIDRFLKIRKSQKPPRRNLPHIRF